MITIPLPKSIEPFRFMLEDWEDDREEDNGYWAYLPQYSEVAESLSAAPHTIHEDSLRHIVYILKQVREEYILKDLTSKINGSYTFIESDEK
jgi:hypothetical protein